MNKWANWTSASASGISRTTIIAAAFAIKDSSCVSFRDAFIHHWHSASFRLMKIKSHHAIVEQNRKVFQAKWDPIDAPSLGKSSASGGPAGAKDDANRIVSFTCNVCGEANQLPRHRISREDGPASSVNVMVG